MKNKAEVRDFPGGPVVKNLPCSAGTTNSIPEIQSPVGVEVREIHNEHKMLGNTQMVVYGLQSLPQPILEERNFLTKSFTQFLLLLFEKSVSSISPIFLFRDSCLPSTCFAIPRSLKCHPLLFLFIYLFIYFCYSFDLPAGYYRELKAKVSFH